MPWVKPIPTAAPWAFMTVMKKTFWKSFGLITAEILLAAITIGAIATMLLPVYASLPR
jgi:hypothetical protein